jgi:cytosine/adenosine deaminase-related metal-dependent hydrolase
LLFLLLTGASHPPPILDPQVVTPIYDIQYTTDPSGDSPYIGQSVTIHGIITAAFVDGYVVAELPGAWHAVYVYSQSHAPDIGAEVELTGSVAEYYGMTQIQAVTDYQVLSTGNSISAQAVNAVDGSQEAYESVLLAIGPAVVTGLEDYGEWTISDATGSIRCDDLNDYMYFPQVGDALDSLSGILFYSFGDYKLEPRATTDIAGSVIPHYALHGTVVTMNDLREVLPDAYLEILGDRVLGLHASPPPGIPVIATGGLIFPGLIDAHNHPHYNILDRIPFGALFPDRYDWQDDPLYDAFKDQFNDILDYGGADAQLANLFKFAEVRALTAGTTTIQGYNANGHQYDSFARQGVGVNNAERFPNRVYAQVFPLRQSEAFWDSKSAEYWYRFLIHLSEGINPAALDEFYAWSDLGLLDERTTIIHGVPYAAPEWTLMASADANLVWSPESNLRLYGQTAQIPGALAAGVNVALAPDWTESGTLHMLDELKVAQQINQTQWAGAISALQMAEMATRNAAQALGAQDRIGKIAPGFMADLMVIAAGSADPYSALLNAHPADVLLTVVNGRPMYGDPSLMAQFPFLSGLESLTVGGLQKQLAIQVESHAIPDAGTSFAVIQSTLESAYQASDPKVCDFLGIERALSSKVFLPLVFQTP